MQAQWAESMDYSADGYIKKVKESTSQSINISVTLQFYFSYINKKHLICCFSSLEEQKAAAFPSKP